MSRCIAKLMYLEKPKRLIIWDGWSKRYFDKQNESENCLILLLPIVFHQISPSNLVYISYWPHCNQVYGWSMHIKHLWCCLTARTFKYTHTESKCQVLGTSRCFLTWRATGQVGVLGTKDGCFVGEQVGISACVGCILWQNKCQNNYGNIRYSISPFKHNYLINSILYIAYMSCLYSKQCQNKRNKFIAQAQSMQKKIRWDAKRW